MSKVTEELDFMWDKRVLGYYNGLKIGSCFEYADDDLTPNSDAMEVIKTVLKLQGLHVKGIEG